MSKITSEIFAVFLHQIGRPAPTAPRFLQLFYRSVSGFPKWNLSESHVKNNLRNPRIFSSPKETPHHDCTTLFTTFLRIGIWFSKMKFFGPHVKNNLHQSGRPAPAALLRYAFYNFFTDRYLIFENESFAIACQNFRNRMSEITSEIMAFFFTKTLHLNSLKALYWNLCT